MTQVVNTTEAQSAVLEQLLPLTGGFVHRMTHHPLGGATIKLEMAQPESYFLGTYVWGIDILLYDDGQFDLEGADEELLAGIDPLFTLDEEFSDMFVKRYSL